MYKICYINNIYYYNLTKIIEHMTLKRSIKDVSLNPQTQHSSS